MFPSLIEGISPLFLFVFGLFFFVQKGDKTQNCDVDNKKFHLANHVDIFSSFFFSSSSSSKGTLLLLLLLPLLLLFLLLLLRFFGKLFIRNLHFLEMVRNLF